MACPQWQTMQNNLITYWLLRRSRDFVIQDVLLTMYNSLVLPHFNYCSNVWNQFINDHINKLYKLQKRAARVITRSNYETRSAQIFQMLHWKPIKDILDKRDLIMIFKTLQGLASNYLRQLLNISNNNSYQLRSNNRNLSLPKPRKKNCKKSFSYGGAVMWNVLPTNIINQALTSNFSVNSFRHLI